MRLSAEGPLDDDPLKPLREVAAALPQLLVPAGSFRAIPAGKVIHVILDNYGAHKHPNVHKWLARHPRWIFHTTPTSCSWLNAVEGFFAKLTKRRLKWGSFHSLVALQEAINRFIANHNQQPKPFVWKADPKAIIAAAKRGHQTLETIH